MQVFHTAMPEAMALGSPRDREQHLVDMGGEELLHLLGAMHFGRLAFDDGDGPVVLPVNFVLDGGDVLVRSAQGAKLDAARRGARAALEVDHVDPVRGGGWSILVRGTLEVDTDPSAFVRRAAMPPAVPAGAKPNVLRLRSDSVSGRRLRRLPAHDAEVGELADLDDDRPWFVVPEDG